MSFNSFPFWIFFLPVFLLYLSFSRKNQNWLLLAASYFFYFTVARGFVLLLFATTLFDFWCGKRIAASAHAAERRVLLALSVLSNLSVLVLFKYVGFFSGLLVGFLGTSGSASYLDLIVPVGISFYILQSMSYVIDVYRRELPPHSRVSEYALYIAFFPQLLAGPIERAGKMLPQFSAPRQVTLVGLRDGVWLCLWGLVEKCVVSDNLQSTVIGPYFQSPGEKNGLATLVVLWSCCMRIYCDFDGYSNIARGLGKMMGFELSLNFLLPMYTVSTKSFWRRFHITFYRWAKDYLFLPLVKNLRLPTALALVIVFSLSGLWHEFRWTFVCWGIFEAFAILVSEFPARALSPIYSAASGLKWWVLTSAGIVSTRFFQMIGAALFLAASVPEALHRVQPIINLPSWRLDARLGNVLLLHLFFNLPMMMVEFVQLYKKDVMAPMNINPWGRAILVYVLSVFLFLFGVTNAQKFIYFQF